MVNKNPHSGQRERTRAIRERMRLTGEPYVVAARRHDDEQAHRPNPRRVPKVRCPKCSDGVVEIDLAPVCRNCGTTWKSGSELANEYAEVFLGLSWYSSMKDGGDAPSQDCPECGEQAVVSIPPEEATFWTMMCLSCAVPWNDSCTRCGAPTQRRAGDGLVCTACWQELVQRD